MRQQEREIKEKKRIIEEVRKKRSEFKEDELNEGKVSEKDVKKLENKIIESNEKLNKMHNKFFGKGGIDINNGTDQLDEDERELLTKKER